MKYFKVGQHVRALRKKTGLNRAAFGKPLGVSEHAVRSWEEGKKTPSGSAQILLEKIYGFTIKKD